MSKSDNLNYDLSKRSVVTLFVYYIILIICGIVGSVIILTKLHTNSLQAEKLLLYTVIVSFSVSMMLNGLQYCKRLYKACITNRIQVSGKTFGPLGNLMYFFLRPLFALVFTIVMIFALLSGMVIVTGNLDFVVNERFLYLCAILSSFIGFSTGQLLDKFESISQKEIEKI